MVSEIYEDGWHPIDIHTVAHETFVDDAMVDEAVVDVYYLVVHWQDTVFASGILAENIRPLEHSHSGQHDFLGIRSTRASLLK